MNEDFVSYELAVKLKACGFDEPCDSYYNLNCEHIKTSEPTKCNWNGLGSLDWISAPLLYHAQKWLREKWNIYAYCEPNCLKKWFARVVDLAKNEDLLFDGEMFDSFEKATEYAISVALELIKKGE